MAAPANGVREQKRPRRKLKRVSRNLPQFFDISAPKTRERGESDNIAERVRQARDLPARRAIPTDARNLKYYRQELPRIPR